MEKEDFRLLCKEFAERAGIAVLEEHEDESIMRWLGAGALTNEQKQMFSDMYNKHINHKEN